MTDELVHFTADELATLVDEVPDEVFEATAAPAIRERVVVHSAPGGRGYLLRPAKEWTWEDLRDYVVAKIVEIHGPFPRDERKEYGIFKGFKARYGANAGPIAQHAYERLSGIWRGAPTGVTRFTKGNDAFFGDVLLKVLTP